MAEYDAMWFSPRSPAVFNRFRALSSPVFHVVIMHIYCIPKICIHTCTHMPDCVCISQLPDHLLYGKFFSLSSHTTGGVSINSTLGASGPLILNSELDALGFVVRGGEAEACFRILGRLSNQPVPDSVCLRRLAGRDGVVNPVVPSTSSGKLVMNGVIFPSTPFFSLGKVLSLSKALFVVLRDLVAKKAGEGAGRSFVGLESLDESDDFA